MSEEQTIISPVPDASEAERTQIAVAPGADVTQAALVVECPVCHTNNPPGDRWCQDCGFLLTSPAPEGLEELPTVSGPRLVLDGREFELRAGQNTIGRVGADVLLADPTVSRHHATLTVEEDGAWIEDVGSTNGTMLNGAPLPPGERRSIQDGDAVKLGSVTVKLVWPEGQRAEGREQRAVEGLPSAAAASPSAGTLVAGDGTEFALVRGVTTLGRRAENQVILTGDPYISGRHAEIRCDADGCVLVDVGSTNGTFLRRADADWERLRSHDPQPLSSGDELRLGQTTFTFLPAEPAGEQETEGEAELFGAESLDKKPEATVGDAAAQTDEEFPSRSAAEEPPG